MQNKLLKRLEINGFLGQSLDIKFLLNRNIFIPVAKEQIRQTISVNTINSITDVYTLLRVKLKGYLSGASWRLSSTSPLLMKKL